MFRLREEVLAEAQLGKTRALRVRRSAKILLPPVPEQVHAERQSAQAPDASSQRCGARKEEIQQPEEDVRTDCLSVRAANKRASQEDVEDKSRIEGTCAKKHIPKTIVELKID